MENYKMIRVVGRGAYGTVSLAKRLVDDREVIIKQIPVEQMSAVDRQGVLVEAKVLAMLQHPNIIEYFDNFLHDQAMMIVMEYAPGGTLYDLLESRAGGGLEEEEVGHLFSQLVLPMYYVHQNQILHRDLKSQNIFVTRSLDHLKIGDFGISKILSSKSKAFSVVGTPCYISPELCEGKAYNTKSDVWALGCILYELCTCRRAFEAPTLPALIIKIMRGIITPLPEHFSPGVKQLLGAMLAVDPSKRPSVPEMMAHHWLAPYVYRLHTSVGGIPCTAKPQRPLSVTRPENLEYPEDKPRFSVKKRSPSPFQKKEPNTAVFYLGNGGIVLQLKPIDPRSDIVSVSVSKTHIIGAESSGGVIQWQEDQAWSREEGANLSQEEGANQLFKCPRRLEGITGINIVQVACGDDFICLLTDRGILFTLGRGDQGCLGHGDTRNVKNPKIVEALLGDEIISVSAAKSHVAIVTGDGEGFTWGNMVGQVAPLPEYIDTEQDIERAVCGPACTALITQEGRLLVSGENKNNRLFLDHHSHIVKGTAKYKVVLEELGEILDISISAKYSLVLTMGGEVYMGGEKSREMVKIETGSLLTRPGVRVAATVQTLFLASADGTVIFWNPDEPKRKEKLKFPESLKKKVESVNFAVCPQNNIIIFNLKN